MADTELRQKIQAIAHIEWDSQLDEIMEIIANERREAAREFPQWVKDNCSHSVYPAAERHNAYTVYVNDVDEFLAQLQPTEEQPNE